MVLEPGKPDLVLARMDATASVPLDSQALPVDPASPVLVARPIDRSAAAIFYGPGTTRASFVDGGGVTHGPFDLSAAGLKQLLSAVALEQAAGAVIFGLSASGIVWTTLGPAGPGKLAPLALGVAPGPAQEPPLVWDDGTGRVSAVFPVTTGSGLALFAMRGFGDPFAFGPAARLDTVAPNGLLGFTVALGPNGETGILTEQGNPASPSLVGFRLTGTGTLAGGLVPDGLSGALGTLTAPAVPWRRGCFGSGTCDPALRFDPAGDLFAAWTRGGSLALAELPAGAGAWQKPAILAGGPLESNLVFGAGGDILALADSPSGVALARFSAGGPAALSLLPQPTGATPYAFLAPTAMGAGAVLGLSQSEPAQLWSDGFTDGGVPAQGPGAPMPGGEQATSLTFAAPALTMSEDPSFFAPAVPGWVALTAAVEASAPAETDVLLSTFDPATASSSPPTSVALPGWQQVGALALAFAVDPQDDAVLFFTQPAGSQSTPPLYAAFAPAGGTPRSPCLAFPATTTGATHVRIAFDQVPFGPKALSGEGRIAAVADTPATAALAR